MAQAQMAQKGQGLIPVQIAVVAAVQVEVVVVRLLQERVVVAGVAVIMAVVVVGERITKRMLEQAVQALLGLFGPATPVHSHLLVLDHHNRGNNEFVY
jgi:hypothetical protein